MSPVSAMVGTGVVTVLCGVWPPSAQIQDTRREMRALHEQVVERIEAVDKGLRQAISAQIQETRTHMRVLHEEVIGRLGTIQDGQSPKRPWRGAKPKKD